MIDMLIFSPSNSFTLPSQFPPPSCLAPTFVCASFRRRTRRRIRRNKLSSPLTTTTTSSEPKLETVLDLTHLTPFQALIPSFRSHYRRFISSGRDAYRDLQTLFTLDDNRRLVLSCRPSTLHFLGTSAALTFLALSVFRVLVQLVSGFGSWRRNASTYKPVVRRDRSLGGKEVVIAWNEGQSHSTPASRVQRTAIAKNKVRVEKKLPKWWPSVINNAAVVFDVNERDEYKRESYRVVRAIVDNRMGGRDISEDDVIRLRQLCRFSGVQVSVEPTNIRDSLYRASVNFVLDACSSAPTYSTSIDINGEDVQQFLAGFAENIGLENVRASTIVSAAVAASTHSRLLQAWALEMQGKHVDATVELSKICLLLRIFPPEESSPEMEMVSRGLQKHLKLEQRKHLMSLFGKVCGEDSHMIAREALGLMHSDQLEDKMAL